MCLAPIVELTLNYSNVVGCFASAAIADKIGRRFTIMITLVLSFVSITLEVVATTNEVFFGGKFLNGFAIGTFQTVSTAYLREVRKIGNR